MGTMMAEKKTGFLIADDHEIVRLGVRLLIEQRNEWEVVGEVATGADALREAVRLSPDIIIMDVSLPEMNGLEAAKHILQRLPDTRILVFTLHDSERLMEEALLAGARAVILKSEAARHFVAAAEALESGRTYFTQKASDILLTQFTQGKASTPSALRGLSRREVEVVKLVAEGKSNKEIAYELSISVKTVETHRAHIMTKLELASTAELIRFAVKNNLVA